MTPLSTDEAALVAAELAAEAGAELLRFRREGRFYEGVAFANEVDLKLAEALARTLDIQSDDVPDVVTADERRRTVALRDALARFIDGDTDG